MPASALATTTAATATIVFLPLQLLLVLPFHTSASASSTLFIQSANATTNPTAVCNDGSIYRFYASWLASSGTAAPPDAAGRWLIQLQGGGGAASDDDMVLRTYDEDFPDLTTSTHLPDEMEGSGLLSGDTAVSPYASFNRIFLPYCSSDVFLAAQPKNTSAGRNYHFQGQAILLIMSALDFVAVQSATFNVPVNQVVVMGVSAGAIGALTFITAVAHTFPQANLSMVLDSGWFPNYDSFIENNATKGLAYTGADQTAEYCKATFQETIGSVRLPCCAHMLCMLENYIPSNVSVFVISSVYDLYILAYSIENYADQNNGSIGFDDQPPLTFLHQVVCVCVCMCVFVSVSVNVSLPFGWLLCMHVIPRNSCMLSCSPVVWLRRKLYHWHDCLNSSNSSLQ
jgi:hypothetical protein